MDRRAPLAVLPDASWLAAFRRRLRAWYACHARDLPWRRSANPYHVWVSEIMLQQTQVATVIPYYARFLAALPTVEALAAADEQEVLRLWEGLGYYRRARQMHSAARRIVSEHGGRFPRDIAALSALPGIGRYTAGAVLSIAFDARLPILEANTVRLFSRLLGFSGDATGRSGQELLWAMAEHLLPRRGSGRLNQALMELGSQVCTPREPGCDACPAAALCRAQAVGCPEAFPAPKKKIAIQARREAAVVVRRNQEILLLQCGPDDWWAGLWDFPRFALDAEGPLAVEREIVAKVAGLTGAAIRLGRHLGTLRHSVTRYRITLHCYEATWLSQRALAPGRSVRWVSPHELDACPLSAPGRKLSRIALQG